MIELKSIILPVYALWCFLLLFFLFRRGPGALWKGCAFLIFASPLVVARKRAVNAGLHGPVSGRTSSRSTLSSSSSFSTIRETAAISAIKWVHENKLTIPNSLTHSLLT